MHFAVRRRIFWSFIISFFVLSPFIILYTAGYRFSQNEFGILKTGTIIVSTDPRQASISINGTETGKTTPTLLRGLRPGRYDISLTKVGYLPWNKRLEVTADQATFASSIRLFKNAAPELRLNGNSVSIWSKTSGTQTLIMENANNDPRVYHLSLIPRIPSSPLVPVATISSSSVTPVDWSPDETKIILEADDGWVVLNLATLQSSRLKSNDAPDGTFTLRFSGDNSLYAATRKQIYLLEKRFDTYTAKPERDSIQSLGKNARISDFWIEADKLYETVSLDASKSVLRISKIGSLNTTITTLSDSGDYHYVASDNNTLVLEHQGDLSFYNVTAEAPTLLKTISGANTAVIGENGQIIYTNGFELQRYAPLTGTSTLLLRSAYAIKKLAWLAGARHVLFASDEGISVVDTQRPEPYTTWLLSPLSSLQNYTTTTDATALYFAGTLQDGTAGLFEQPL